MYKYLSLLVILIASGCLSQPGVSVSTRNGGLTVEPVTMPNEQYPFTNPTCEDLGYDFELKIDDVNGPFGPGTFSSADGYLVVNGGSADGVYFTFSSNVGVDVVLMKGGNGANAYFYSSETTSATSLVSPNNASGGPAAISHVSFCYDYEVEVTKSAATSFTRNFAWAIDKTSPTTTLLLATGQVQVVPYTVVVTTTGYSDYDFAVSGTITVTNPAPIAATIESVNDAMGDLAAAVDCGTAFPLVLAPGQTLSCSYVSALPDATSRTNVATVVTSGLVGGNLAQAAVEFAAASVTNVDDCVDVNDSMTGPLGHVCTATSPQTFFYTANVGPYGAERCTTTQQADNVASFVAASGEAGSDTWSIPVSVVCAPVGCTLTQGYWKTHSSYGPAPYDDNWAQLSSGADTPFFNTGKSWYQVFWTAPAGNAYYNLAHQFMAASLNVLNGADAAIVTGQLASAAEILSAYTPSTLPNRMRSTVLSLASLLDAYNNGSIGPGHCSE